MNQPANPTAQKTAPATGTPVPQDFWSQYETTCPACLGRRLEVVFVKLAATGRGLRSACALRPDGFEIDGLPKGASTEDERVRCADCNAYFRLQELTFGDDGIAPASARPRKSREAEFLLRMVASLGDLLQAGWFPAFAELLDGAGGASTGRIAWKPRKGAGTEFLLTGPTEMPAHSD